MASPHCAAGRWLFRALSAGNNPAPSSRPGRAMRAGLLPAVALLPALLLCPPAPAMDQGGNHAVWGKGATSCHSYTGARSEGKEGKDGTAYRNFLMGFLTAANILMDETYSISGSKGLGEILLWLDEYCEEQPMSAFEAALSAFAADSYKQRLRRSGSQW